MRHFLTLNLNYETVEISNLLVKKQKSSIKNQTSKTEHPSERRSHRKRVSSMFRHGGNPTGFSYWYSKAKAEIHSLGFSDFILIFSFFCNKTLYIIQ